MKLCCETWLGDARSLAYGFRKATADRRDDRWLLGMIDTVIPTRSGGISTAGLDTDRSFLYLRHFNLHFSASRAGQKGLVTGRMILYLTPLECRTSTPCFCFRRGDRVVEGAALEMLCTSQGYRGFESRPLRQLIKRVISVKFQSDW